MSRHTVSRRRLLKLGTAAVAAEFGSLLLSGCGGGGILSPPASISGCGKLTDRPSDRRIVVHYQDFHFYDPVWGCEVEMHRANLRLPVCGKLFLVSHF